MDTLKEIREGFFDAVANPLQLMNPKVRMDWMKIINSKNVIRRKLKNGKNIIVIRKAIFEEDKLNEWISKYGPFLETIYTYADPSTGGISGRVSEKGRETLKCGIYASFPCFFTIPDNKFIDSLIEFFG